MPSRLERPRRVPTPLVAMWVLAGFLAPPLAADVAIVTGSPAVVAALDEEQARGLWLGTIDRVDGVRLAIADRSDAEIRGEFYRRVLYKTRGQVKAIRAKRAFQHGIAPPPEFPDDQSVLAWVRAQANRLGYVDAAAVEEPADGSVTVLLTIEVPEGSDER